MSKLQFESAIPNLLLVLIIAAASFAVIYFYRSTKPEIHGAKRHALVALRSLVIACFIVLIADPILRYFFAEKQKQKFHILIDNSKSAKPYQALYKDKETELKALASEYKIPVKTVKFNSDDKSNYTDISEALNELSKGTKTNDLVFLLSDGNHNAASEFKESYPFHLYGLPIGKMPEGENLQINAIELSSEIKNLNEISRIPVVIEADELVEKLELVVSVNGKKISERKLSSISAETLIAFPFTADVNDSIFLVKAELKAGNFKTSKTKTITLKKQLKELAYISYRPNLNAKFTHLALSKDDFRVRFYSQVNLADLAKAKSDLLLASDLADFTKSELNLIQSYIKTNELPYILTGKLPKSLEKLSILEIRTSLGKKRRIQINSNESKLFTKFFQNYNASDLIAIPPLRSRSIILKLEKPFESESVLANQLSLIKKSSIPRAIIINSDDFWKVHLSTQNKLELSNFYKDALSLATSIISTKPNDFIKINFNAKKIFVNQKQRLTITAKDINGKAVGFDRLKVQLLNKGIVENEQEFPFSESGKYSTELSFSKLENNRLKIESYTNNKLVLQKYFSIQVADFDQEKHDLYINQNLFSTLNAIQLDTINSSKIEANILAEESQVIKQEPFYPIQSKILLYILLFLLVLEWLFRKQFRLL